MADSDDPLPLAVNRAFFVAARSGKPPILIEVKPREAHQTRQPPRISHDQLVIAVRGILDEAWQLATEVRHDYPIQSSRGRGRKSDRQARFRRADLIATRDGIRIGFEVKTNWIGFLTELCHPEKRQPACAACKEFYFVVPRWSMPRSLHLERLRLGACGLMSFEMDGTLRLLRAAGSADRL